MRSWSRLGMRKGVDRMSPVAIPIRTVCPARRPASRKRHGLSLATAFLLLDFFFFFQAEDGIRDPLVTGVQTCALPIFRAPVAPSHRRTDRQGAARPARAAPQLLERCGERDAYVRTIASKSIAIEGVTMVDRKSVV